VDCAIKYRGRRNYFNKKTAKGEPVIDCETRAKNGVDIIAVSPCIINMLTTVYIYVVL